MRYGFVILWLAGSAAAQNVGIGTTAPSHKLHLANVSATDLGLLRVEALATTHGSLGTFSATGVLGNVPKTGDPKDVLRGDLTFGPDPTDWRLLGNAGTDPSSNFLGTTDNQPLVFRTNNTERMRILTDGSVWIGTTAALTPSNNILNIRSSDDAAGQRALSAQSDTIAIYGEATDGLGPGVAGVYASNATVGVGFFARGNGLNTFPTNINPVGFVAQGTVRGIMGEARSTTAEPRMGGYFTNGAASTFARIAAYNGGTAYKVLGTGSVNTVVHDGAGGVRMLTAPEAPEFLFQDFGEAQLSNGTAYIRIEPKLLPHIQVEKLQVFLTPLGPCAGLYVMPDPKGEGFFVKERQGGQSQVRFMWAWSAPVKTWGRFPPVTPPPTTQTPSRMWD